MSRVPKFDVSSGAPVLLCPKCNDGAGYLSHFHVDVYDRQEDDEVGLSVSVHLADGNVIVDKYSNSVSEVSRNPSARRGGIVVSLRCEKCENVSCLTIAQDKGQTVVEHKIAS